MLESTETTASGNVVTAVGWNRALATDSSTSFIVLGTSRGLLIEASMDSAGTLQYWKQLHAISDDRDHRRPIGGLSLERCEGADDRWLVIAVTAGQLFPFVGSASTQATAATSWLPGMDFAPVLGPIFAAQADGHARHQSMDPSPSADAPAGLYVYWPTLEGTASAYAWLASPGIIHGALALGCNDADNDALNTIIQDRLIR